MEHMEIESHEGKKQDEEGHHHNNEVARLEEYKKFIDAKTALRQSNLNPERPDASHLRTLDSSIKRNTAVIKKLRVINDEQKDGLMEELKSVNLSKFVSEAVSYISEAKLRSADIQAAVQICSLLHQRYKDFSPCLIQGLLKAFFPGKSGDDIDSDKNSRAMKKRSTLKLLMELYFVGIVEDASTFINIIKDLTSVEHLKDRETTQTNLSLASFARQGKHFLGLQKHGQEAYDEFFMGLNVTDDLKTFFKKALSSYYDAAVAVLQSEHASLRALESENAKILNAKGELSDENTALYEKLRKSFDQLLRCVSSLAEALDMQPPVMPDDGHTTRVTTVAELSPSGKDFSAVEPIWDDEDTKAFYESLPDLRVFVPGVLLGEAEPKLVDQHGKVNEQTGEPKLEQGTEVQNNAETSVPEHQLEGQTNVGSKNRENKDKTGKEISKEKDADQKGDTEREKARVTDGASLDSLLQRLPRCVSRDLIDQLTVEFCYLNSKANRKKLARVLFNVPRTSLELLPYYSRLVATLSTCMKDLPSMLLSMLEEEFNFLMNKKDQIKIETKIRNIRFIGELCKFNIAPSSLVFSCLKACLDDFSHHNIDVACNLLETCGRFLYLSQGTTVRMANMLEILKRLKNVKNLDPHHSTLVENAYYLCKPPERSARVSKVRPPLHQYIRKLLFSDLDKTSVQHVLRQLRKLPWAECEQYLVKCFLKVHKGKYSQVHLIALLTAGLSHYHDDFHVAVVDEVLEEIRVGLELNDYAMQQRQLAHMRFLGELYNYEHIDSSVIFETMYLIIVFGHGTPEQDLLDPPEDFFRIRMIVTLLQTCGHYFDRGSSKRKLDRFLLHFQRYILNKGPLPLDVEFDVQDMFAELRPNMTRYSSAELLASALVELEENEKAKQSESAASDASCKSSTNRPDKNGRDHEEVADSESYSGSRSIYRDGSEDGDSLYEENSDDRSGNGVDDDMPASSDEEERVQVRHKLVQVDPKEQEDFDRELKALLQESLESRKLEPRVKSTLNMTVPMKIVEGSKDWRATETESGEELAAEESGNAGVGSEVKVCVRVLVKKGHKQQTRQMLIPGDCSLVQSTKQQEAALLEERQNIKQKILEYNEREEEEFNASSLQAGFWGQGGSSAGGSIIGSGGRGSWDGSNRGGRGGRQRYYIAGGIYHGYGRGR
ncbi:Regulator of nonsense transcripts 2 [Hordeum vulgare]|nr:Regulator of nonsense transcripts 2 [Hordeum vulgare]